MITGFNQLLFLVQRLSFARVELLSPGERAAGPGRAAAGIAGVVKAAGVRVLVPVPEPSSCASVADAADPLELSASPGGSTLAEALRDVEGDGLSLFPTRHRGRHCPRRRMIWKMICQKHTSRLRRHRHCSLFRHPRQRKHRRPLPYP